MDSLDDGIPNHKHHKANDLITIDRFAESIFPLNPVILSLNLPKKPSKRDEAQALVELVAGVANELRTRQTCCIVSSELTQISQGEEGDSLEVFIANPILLHLFQILVSVGLTLGEETCDGIINNATKTRWVHRHGGFGGQIVSILHLAA